MDQIFSATYSGVNVYEFITVTGSVMRRKSDGWVNATHILKAANFPKAKRTRILERDVQVGEHEKVQGGYGKYQGTWVPLDRAKSIAKEFAVDELLAPLFTVESTFGESSPPPAPKHHHASKNNSVILDKPPSQRKAASMAAAARKTASMPAQLKASSSVIQPSKKRGRPKRATAQVSNPNEGVFVGKRLNQLSKNLDSVSPGISSEDKDSEIESEEEITVNDGLVTSDIDDSSNMGYLGNTSSPSEFMSDTDLANALRSPDQKVHQSARESLERAITSHTEHIRNNLNEKWIDSSAEFTGRLLEFFMQPDDRLSNEVPDFLLTPPQGLNIDQIIDEEGHTAFHWACSMGNTQVADILLNLGANYRAVNNAGETPLIRAVQFTNAYTKRTFPRLVDMLSEIIFELDSNHRTVLHHMASAASSKSRVPSAVYYMDILLAKIAGSQSSERVEGFLNLQDNNGDTALHLCAKNANRKCIKLLLEYKAKTNIKNNQGRIASDILLDNENVTPKVQQRYEMHLKNKINSESRFPQNYIAMPHISEAAIEATHKVSNFLIESLTELSNAYDYELERKESDIHEVQDLLKNMNEDIKFAHLKTREYLGENLNETQLHDRLKSLEDQVKLQESLSQKKEIKLRRMLERSQKRDLEKLVTQQESDVGPDVSNGGDSMEKTDSAIELTKLQLNRKRILNDVLKLYEGMNESNEKMLKYRRLISACSDVEIDEVSHKVDDLLQEIEKEL